MAVAPYRRVGIPTVRSVSADNNKPEFDGEWVRLGDLLTEYKELNVGNRYRPVAVGRFGIRAREDIYTKELAKDYSKNKVIHQNTLTVGMGSKQIDIGILTSEDRYSVSPAYHTYRICEVDCDYLRYCLEARNADMFKRFAKRGTRQGKTIDLKRWLGYRIYLPSKERQVAVVRRLDAIERQIDNCKSMGQRLDDLVKSQFVEMFGDPVEVIDATPLGSIALLKAGNATTAASISETDADGLYPCYGGNGLRGYAAEFTHEGDFPLIGRQGAHCGNVKLTSGKFRATEHAVVVQPTIEIDPIWLFHYLRYDDLGRLATGAAQPGLSVKNLNQIPVSIPPIALQQQFADFVARVDKLGFRRPISIGAYVSDSQGRLINLAVSRVAYRRKVIVNEEISSPIRTSR